MNRLVHTAKLSFRGTDRGRPSNKVYIAELIEVDDSDRYIVTGWNGPRGGTLTKQKKITTPTFYDQARREFDELVSKKLNHNRTPYEYDDSVPDTRPANERTAPTAPFTSNLRDFQSVGMAQRPLAQSRVAPRPAPAKVERKEEQKETTLDRLDALEF